ncbi:MAG: ATP-binding protein [Paludibacteraceae bacterium]|nr:ATP-binding protein [Paludibacteraceae bacterium]
MKENILYFNPFSITSYIGPEYFCDRINETKEILDALRNRRNVTLISPRRVGKTGLIQHLFHTLDPKQVHCIYVDLFSTSNLQEFTKVFAEAVLSARITPYSERVWQEITHFFGSLRPIFTPDPVTGMMQCSIDIQPQREEWTLQQIFAYLEKSALPCYIALDEFQVIAEYQDVKMEALLRSYIQQLTNVQFIFAGSKKHMMTEMFASAKRPFYRSSQMMNIDVINEQQYYLFASKHLAANGQQIDENTFHELYRLVDGYTWFVQALLNRLHQSKVQQIDFNTVLQTLNQILQEEEASYQMYCRLITDRQLHVIQAVAKEGTVKEPGSNVFLQKYQLGAYSTVRGAIQTMVEKELLYQKDDGSYVVYDKFFGLWLHRQH